MARLSDIAAVTGGRLVGQDAEFSGAVIDSRRCESGNLFVALPGKQADGHDFVEAAALKGAAGALVASEQNTPLAQVVVDDVLAALQKYAAAHRRAFAGPVIGVTGTNGKTTTKEILAAVLSHAMGEGSQVLYTQGNLNNHIGVPLTLLGLRPQHAAAVIEMGANHIGDIAMLSAIAQPNVGIVTLAGAGHLEGFGNVAGVARGKGEMFSGLPESGVAIINADDDYAGLWQDLAQHCQQLSFGLTEPSNVRADNLRMDNGHQLFRLHTPVGNAEVRLPLSGKHNVMNALAAAAAAVAIGLSVDSVAAGLTRANTIGGRLQIIEGPDGARIVDDSYNANPTSVKAALDWLSEQPGRRWFAFGAMGELGEDAVKWHRQIGEWAREAGVHRLFTVGELTAETAASFGQDAVNCSNHEEVVTYLRSALAARPAADVTLLVKGSRSAHMERVVEALKQAADETESEHGYASHVVNGG